MRTADEIEAEIANLRMIQGDVRSADLLGTDTLAAIDAQIEVLSKRMDEHSVFSEWGVQNPRNPERTALAATFIACRWIHRSLPPGTPSEVWRELLRYAEMDPACRPRQHRARSDHATRRRN